MAAVLYFLDLSLGEFKEIQDYLLLEQVKQVADTPLGSRIMGGRRPASAVFPDESVLVEPGDVELARKLVKLGLYKF
ncbi:MAG: hypothetical protein EXR53_06050 [Dehalococcoidia bacterium]|nr:hypothetical protein [Dehalococcoidia bacterium]